MEPNGVAAVQHLGLADEKDKRAPKKGGGALAASSSADSDGQADEEASSGADATSVPAEASAPGPVRASGSRWGEPAPASPVPAPVWADCAAAMLSCTIDSQRGSAHSGAHWPSGHLRFTVRE